MPCEWPIDRSCLPELPPEGSGTDYDAAAAAQDAAENLAIQVLWTLSGSQFGVCPYIVRPCVETVGSRWGRGGYTSYSYGLILEDGHWSTPYWYCGCSVRCRSSGPGAVHLPGPAQEVVEVIVDGTILDPDQYVLEGDVLHRVGGSLVWPPQDLSRPMGEVGTWSVEYLRGNPVPAGVDRLTGLLANEFLAACSGGPCRLPRNVTSVTRQGISYQVDSTALLAAGKTGLAEVDLWLSAVNPHRLQCAPTVL